MSLTILKQMLEARPRVHPHSHVGHLGQKDGLAKVLRHLNESIHVILVAENDIVGKQVLDGVHHAPLVLVQILVPLNALLLQLCILLLAPVRVWRVKGVVEVVLVVLLLLLLVSMVRDVLVHHGHFVVAKVAPAVNPHVAKLLDLTMVLLLRYLTPAVGALERLHAVVRRGSVAPRGALFALPQKVLHKRRPVIVQVQRGLSVPVHGGPGERGVIGREGERLAEPGAGETTCVRARAGPRARYAYTSVYFRDV